MHNEKRFKLSVELCQTTWCNEIDTFDKWTELGPFHIMIKYRLFWLYRLCSKFALSEKKTGLQRIALKDRGPLLLSFNLSWSILLITNKKMVTKWRKLNLIKSFYEPFVSLPDDSRTLVIRNQTNRQISRFRVKKSDSEHFWRANEARRGRP